MCSCANRAALRKKQHNTEVHKKVKLPRVIETVSVFLDIHGPQQI